ncbi:MAG: hypothetical protein LV479_01400 [Methylacidiphilales bacterium]|nr:hypothetical protein [Candidatus Methylacidiphilales bacterium]
MLQHRYAKWAWVILFLIVANIISYYYWNWGLITVHVNDAPLGKVIKSIEWQGWVNIYTNLDPSSKVSMDVDHVPLAEAMEMLAARVSGPPMGADREDRPDRPDRPDRANRPDGNGAPPGGIGGTAGGAPSPGGGPPPDGGGRGGFGRGGFGGAQWNLAFFVAPTSAEVKAEIQAFQSGTTDDDTRVYMYPTPLQMISSGDDMPAADPRQQSWPGMKPAAAPTPTPTPDPTSSDQIPPPGADPSTPAADADATPTVQTYLQAFAQSSNILILAPGSWTAPVSGAPPAPDSSIISAVKGFIGRCRGSVTQAIVLRMGRVGRSPGGPRGGGGFADIDDMADRMRNAINGLPEDARADALNQLNNEVNFYHTVQAAPPEQRRDMIRQHTMEKMTNGNNNWRRTPEQRAARYQRVVSNRMTAQGKK